MVLVNVLFMVLHDVTGLFAFCLVFQLLKFRIGHAAAHWWHPEM